MYIKKSIVYLNLFHCNPQHLCPYINFLSYIASVCDHCTYLCITIVVIIAIIVISFSYHVLLQIYRYCVFFYESFAAYMVCSSAYFLDHIIIVVAQKMFTVRSIFNKRAEISIGRKGVFPYFMCLRILTIILKLKYFKIYRNSLLDLSFKLNLHLFKTLMIWRTS